jgi:hypothetical protein
MLILSLSQNQNPGVLVMQSADRLMAPELVKEFIAELHREVNRLTWGFSGASWTTSTGSSAA